MHVWNLSTKQLLAMSRPQPDYVDALTVLTTGWVAYAANGGVLRFWAPHTGRKRSLLAARPTSNLVPSSDGASIIFGTADGKIEVWDAGTGQRHCAMRIPDL